MLKPWQDIHTARRIAKLNPYLQVKCWMHLIQCYDLGIKLRVTQGLRTFAEQDQLYRQGRAVPGKRVTNAVGGSSWHNYGLAYDVVEMLDGKPTWDTPNWEQIGSIGEENGLSWGGRWKKFKDLPHFEWHPGLIITTARKVYNANMNKPLHFVWEALDT